MPAATASLSGKIYIGEQLTGTYTYSEPALGEEEGDSIAYWEISDTPTFDSPTRLTGDIIMKAGEVSTYTIKEEDYGKYIRFCVIPKSISGEVGYTAVSEPTSAIAVYDIPTLNISPGRTEQELNFAWYCPKDFTDAVVQIAPKTQENIETFPETGVMSITGVQNETAIEYMANKVTVSDIRAKY